MDPMSNECMDLCEAIVGMTVEEVTAELDASGRFQDPAGVATYLASLAEGAAA